MTDDVAEADCSAACAALVEAGVRDRRLARFGRLRADEQRGLFREIHRLARGYRRQGLGPDDAAPLIARHIGRNAEYRSIVATLLMAALAAIVQLLVKRWWDRWFPDNGGRS